MKKNAALILSVAAISIFLFSSAMAVNVPVSNSATIKCTYTTPGADADRLGVPPLNYYGCGSSETLPAPDLNGNYTYTYTLMADDWTTIWSLMAASFAIR